MVKECLYYNGELGCYDLLDFDPNELTKEQVADKAWDMLKEGYNFEEEDKEKVMETLYLLDVEHLERVI